MRFWLDKMESRGSSVARFCALVGMLGLVALTLMTNTDVLMRWLFDRPIDGVADIAPLVIAIVVAAFFPFAISGRHHISIGFLGTLLGPRIRAWLEAFAALAALAFFVALAWQFIVFTMDLRAVGQTTWAVQIPVAPFWSVVCVFLVISAAVQLNLVIRHIERAWNVSGDDDGISLPPDNSSAVKDGS